MSCKKGASSTHKLGPVEIGVPWRWLSGVEAEGKSSIWHMHKALQHVTIGHIRSQA